MSRPDVELGNGHVRENHEMGNMSNGDGAYMDHPQRKHSIMEFFHHDKKQRLPRGIKEAGESNRRGFAPLKFLKICGKSTSRVSMFVNVLWPFVPAGIAVYYLLDKNQNSDIIFALNFLAMIPTANLLGFAGQELARKLPIVFGQFIVSSSYSN